MDIVHFLTDPQALIAALGVAGVVAVIFMETGFFFGFFFPGDSLLFMAGFLATQNKTSLAILLAGCFLAAVLGDAVGYVVGKKAGPAIFVKDDSLFFNRKHVARAQHFYEKYGKKTIFLARFVPIVRTFAPVVAGVGGMRYRTFAAWNIAGGLAWTWGMLLLGYGFGSIIPDPDRYVLPAVAVIVVISLLPPLREILKKRML
ncbi:MAG: VTT domain-containing protein [Patescibacteria group bacterium]|nr:VTT domain-containing protein [Patescibacteria group bacterium]